MKTLYCVQAVAPSCKALLQPPDVRVNPHINRTFHPLDDFDDLDRRPLPISDDLADDEEHVHAHEMLCSNVVVVRKGGTLHIIQRREPWSGHGPLYVCGCSSVLLTLLIWNILSCIYTLIICIIGFRCLAEEKCAEQQIWIALLVLASAILAAAIGFSVSYGAPYFRDTVYDVSHEHVRRVYVLPLFNLAASGGKKRTVRHGQVTLKVPP